MVKRLLLLQLVGLKGLFFGYARYRFEDGGSDEVYLKIDYKNNKYKLVPTGINVNNDFGQEVENIAIDLLKRKYGVNIVKQPLR